MEDSAKGGGGGYNLKITTYLRHMYHHRQPKCLIDRRISGTRSQSIVSTLNVCF